MSLIVTLIIGGIVGWLAAQMMGREEGIAGSIAIGVIGAFIGSILSRMLGYGAETYMTFSWVGVIWSLIGAVIFAAILNALRRGSSRHHV